MNISQEPSINVSNQNFITNQMFQNSLHVDSIFIEEERKTFGRKQKQLFDLNQSYKEQNLKRDDGSEICEPDANSWFQFSKQQQNVSNTNTIRKDTSVNSQTGARCNNILGTPVLQGLQPSSKQGKRSQSIEDIHLTQFDNSSAMRRKNQTMHNNNNFLEANRIHEHLQRQRKKTSQMNSVAQSPVIGFTPLRKTLFTHQNNSKVNRNQNISLYQTVNQNQQQNQNSNSNNQFVKLFIRQAFLKRFRDVMVGLLQNRRLEKLTEDHINAISDVTFFKGKKFKRPSAIKFSIFQDLNLLNDQQQKLFIFQQNLNKNKWLNLFPNYNQDSVYIIRWDILIWQKDEENYTINKGKSMQNYLKNQLIFDILPLLQISLGNYFWLLQCFGIFHYFHLVRVQELITNYYQLVERYNTSVVLFNLIQLILLVSHYTAAIFLAIALNYTDRQGNWLEDRKIENDFWYVQYIDAFYFSVITMVTVGYGDVTPISFFEKVYAIFMALISCGIFAYFIQTIGNIFQEKQQKNAELKIQKFEVLKYMRHRDISKPLQLRVLNQLSIEIKKQEELKMSGFTILSKTSKTLQNEVLREFFGQTIKQQKMFNAIFSDKFLNELVTCMKEIVLGPKEVLFNQGQLNCQNLYILTSGEISMYVSRKQEESDHYSQNQSVSHQNNQTIDYQNQQTMNQDRDKKSFSQSYQKFIKIGFLSKGQMFNHNQFFFNKQTEFRAQSRGTSNIAYIPYQEFFHLLKKFPREYEKFCSFKDDKLLKLSIIKDYCPLCKQNIHKFWNCDLVFYTPNRALVNLANNISVIQKERRPNKRYRNHKEDDQNKNNFNNNHSESNLLFQEFSHSQKSKSKVYFHAYINNTICKQKLKEIRLDLLPQNIADKVVDDFLENQWGDEDDEVFLVQTPEIKFSIDGQFICKENDNNVQNTSQDNFQYFQPYSPYYSQQQQQHQQIQQQLQLNQLQQGQSPSPSGEDVISTRQNFNKQQSMIRKNQNINQKQQSTVLSSLAQQGGSWQNYGSNPNNNTRGNQIFSANNIIIQNSDSNNVKLSSQSQNNSLNFIQRNMSNNINNLNNKNNTINNINNINNNNNNNNNNINNNNNNFQGGNNQNNSYQYIIRDSEQVIRNNNVHNTQQSKQSSRKNSQNVYQNQFQSSNLSNQFQAQQIQHSRLHSNFQIPSQQDVRTRQSSQSLNYQGSINHINSNLMNGITNSNFNMSYNYFDYIQQTPSYQQKRLQLYEVDPKEDSNLKQNPQQDVIQRQHSFRNKGKRNSNLGRRFSDKTLSIVYDRANSSINSQERNIMDKSYESNLQYINNIKKGSFDNQSSYNKKEDSFSLPKFKKNVSKDRRQSFMSKYKEGRQSNAGQFLGQGLDLQLNSNFGSMFNGTDYSQETDYNNIKMQRQMNKKNTILSLSNINKLQSQQNGTRNNIRQQSIAGLTNNQVYQQLFLDNQQDIIKYYPGCEIYVNYIFGMFFLDFERMYNFKVYKVYNNPFNVIKKLNQLQNLRSTIKKNSKKFSYNQINSKTMLQQKFAQNSAKNVNRTNTIIEQQESDIKKNQYSDLKQNSQNKNENIEKIQPNSDQIHLMQQKLLEMEYKQQENQENKQQSQNSQQIQQIQNSQQIQQIQNSQKHNSYNLPLKKSSSQNCQNMNSTQINHPQSLVSLKQGSQENLLMKDSYSNLPRKNKFNSNMNNNNMSSNFLSLNDVNKQEDFEALTPSKRKPIEGHWQTPKYSNPKQFVQRVSQQNVSGNDQILSVSSSCIDGMDNRSSQFKL